LDGPHERHDIEAAEAGQPPGGAGVPEVVLVHPRTIVELYRGEPGSRRLTALFEGVPRL
jgi:hypothetical protein